MAIPIQIMVKNGNAEIVWLLSLDMVPFVTIRYQTLLPILKQPVLIYPFRPFLQPDLSEISHISTKPGEKQHFWIMKYITTSKLQLISHWHMVNLVTSLYPRKKKSLNSEILRRQEQELEKLW